MDDTVDVFRGAPSDLGRSTAFVVFADQDSGCLSYGTEIDAHLAVAAAGFVEVDLYDGCFLYDFTARRMRLVDLDEYRPGPFTLVADWRRRTGRRPATGPVTGPAADQRPAAGP